MVNKLVCNVGTIRKNANSKPYLSLYLGFFLPTSCYVLLKLDFTSCFFLNPKNLFRGFNNKLSYCNLLKLQLYYYNLTDLFRRVWKMPTLIVINNL